MKQKKNPKIDLEKKRVLFLMLGLALALLLVYVILEWSVPRGKVKDINILSDNALETEMLITKKEEPPKPMPERPKPKQKIIQDIIEITKDKTKVTQNLITDAGMNQDDTIDIQQITPDEENVVEEPPFVRVEQMPQFPGGDKALLKFLGKHLNYPQVAAENGIQGKVYLKFVVEKNGEVGEVQILRSPDKLLSKEAVRVVKTLPKFTPGMQRGKPARVWYQVPVTFRLQ